MFLYITIGVRDNFLTLHFFLIFVYSTESTLNTISRRNHTLTKTNPYRHKVHTTALLETQLYTYSVLINYSYHII